MNNKIFGQELDQIKSINNRKFSIIAQKDSIPVANEVGKLDSSWITNNNNLDLSDKDFMLINTYDSDRDGKVDFSKQADKIFGKVSKDTYYGTNENGEQQFFNIENLSNKIKNVKLSENTKQIEINEEDKVKYINHFWGINSQGIQNWIPLKDINFLLFSIYDKNNDGIIDFSENANKISIEPLPNQVWASNEKGNQTWLNLNIKDIMKLSYFATKQAENFKVDYSILADHLSSEKSSNFSTFYSKNKNGQIGFFTLNEIINDEYIKKEDVDKDNDGIIDFSKNLFDAKNADKSTIYSKAIDGTIGFNKIEEIDQKLMMTNVYDRDNDGIVDLSNECLNIRGYKEADIDTFYGKDINGNIGFLKIINKKNTHLIFNISKELILDQTNKAFKIIFDSVFLENKDFNINNLNEKININKNVDKIKISLQFEFENLENEDVTCSFNLKRNNEESSLEIPQKIKINDNSFVFNSLPIKVKENDYFELFLNFKTLTSTLKIKSGLFYIEII